MAQTKQKYHWLLLWGCFFASLHQSFGQSSQYTFTFLDHPTHTHVAGLGGVNQTATGDPLMFVSNPALMDSAHHGLASFHFLNYPGGINIASLGYSFQGPANGTWAAGLQYFNYGEFEGYDDTGFSEGKFQANEFALSLGYSQRRGVFQYGGTLKVLGSLLESYSAYAAVMDFGVSFDHPEEELKITFAAKNLGFPISSYVQGQHLKLPVDVRVGVSYKPEHMPVRFHVAARNLRGEEADFFISDQGQIQEDNSTGEKVFRRLVWGAEILAHENFHLRMGYNHLLRKEFAVPSGNGLCGFSGGFRFRVKKFELSYSRMFYQIASGTNLVGVVTNINQLRSF